MWSLTKVSITQLFKHPGRFVIFFKEVLVLKKHFTIIINVKMVVLLNIFNIKLWHSFLWFFDEIESSGFFNTYYVICFRCITFQKFGVGMSYEKWEKKKKTKIIYFFIFLRNLLCFTKLH